MARESTVVLIRKRRSDNAAQRVNFPVKETVSEENFWPNDVGPGTRQLSTRIDDVKRA
jgi:hypothetical protein